MQVYLVGGAVRDELLGLEPRERDYCVVGATPQELLDAGYRQVGKDFPVFLHPESGEEYALARTERKTAPGYRGFAFDTSPEITLEDDLGRRDLTINAIARDENGTLVDPYDGSADIESRTLRHVSPAFREDPVRILRAARFAARFAGLGFSIADETMRLMCEMVAAGEADALVPDRVWKETERALSGPAPQVFFQVLRDCGALRAVYPEIDALFGVPQPLKWHPEGDCGVHILLTLEQSVLLSDALEVRFAVLVHDLGKARTDPGDLPSHPGHGKRGVQIIEALSKRLPVPKSCRELGILTAEYHGHCHRALELRPATILKVFEKTDAFRRPERFALFLLACEADARGRTGLEDRAYPQAAFLAAALEAAAGIEMDEVIADETDGKKISQAISNARRRAITTFKRRYVSESGDDHSSNR